jgi:5-methylcytosine-specific restriction enzyme subunit McrC
VPSCPSRTADRYYGGSLSVVCERDEFEFDTPLNRVLKAGLGVVLGSPVLAFDTRRSAQRTHLRFDGVGELRADDLRATLDRRSSHYGDALHLAKNILTSSHRALEAGQKRVWTFLLRTPNLVEDGLRRILIGRFGSQTIDRWATCIAPNVTLNPDLVISGGVGVADVKYKLIGGDLNRADLYQAVAFATGFRCAHAAVMGFRTPDEATHALRLQVGEVAVRHILWPAHADLLPGRAAELFLADVADWLASVASVRDGRRFGGEADARS